MLKISENFPEACYCHEDDVITFIKVHLIQPSFLGVKRLNYRVSSVTREKKPSKKSSFPC